MSAFNVLAPVKRNRVLLLPSPFPRLHELALPHNHFAVAGVFFTINIAL
jgi:hypothetical protein